MRKTKLSLVYSAPEKSFMWQLVAMWWAYAVIVPSVWMSCVQYKQYK